MENNDAFKGFKMFAIDFVCLLKKLLSVLTLRVFLENILVPNLFFFLRDFPSEDKVSNLPFGLKRVEEDGCSSADCFQSEVPDFCLIGEILNSVKL